jgi:hypothetical protein
MALRSPPRRHAIGWPFAGTAGSSGPDGAPLKVEPESADRPIASGGFNGCVSKLDRLDLSLRLTPEEEEARLRHGMEPPPSMGADFDPLT